MHRQVKISRSGHVIATEAWLRKSARNAVVRAEARHRSAIGRLLAGVSIGAAALAFLAVPTHIRAQAVVGTPTIQFGIENVDRTVPGTDTVNVTASEALLDWNSTSSSGVFLPEGSTLRFQRDGSDYTVLNRVTSSVAGGPLSIAGQVSSDSYGKVWFYNPGGWVVGATGVFNVGSLVLTTLPITVDPSTDTVSRLFGDKGEIRFGAAPDAASAVTIAKDARINADLAAGSYVGLVAPKVSQGGTVRVNGSAAFVAAEAATMTINNGLFDIVVDTGSSDATGVSHTGSTGGPAGSLSDPDHRIYLVAVPKNQAMTAVVAGSLGYDAAVSASSESDGSIVLSAGRNVLSGGIAPDSGNGSNASLLIQGLDASNAVNGSATGGVRIDATAANVDLRGGAFLNAQRDIAVNVSGGNALTVNGTLDLRSSDTIASGAITVAVGSGSSVVVDGDFSAISSAEGVIQVDPGNGDVLLADSVGANVSSGDVTVSLRDADFTVGGLTTLMSAAIGGVGALSTGSATAGDVAFTALQDNPAVTRAVSLGQVELTSNASAGSGRAPQVPVTGSASTSGAAEFSVDGGQLSTSSLIIGTNAQASAGTDLAPQQATTGSVEISFANSVEGFSAGSIRADNNASAYEGGLVTQGDVSLSLDNASLNVGGGGFGYLGLRTFASGTLSVPNTVNLALSNGSSLDLGTGYVDLSAGSRQASGAQRAADLAVSIDASTFTADNLYAFSSARGADGGGSARSGNVSLTASNGGSLNVASSVYLDTDGLGGNGDDAGDGTGGNIDVLNDSGRIAASYFSASSTGTAGFRGSATGRTGTGFGGTTTLRQTGSNASFAADTIVAESLGFGNRRIESRLAATAQASSTGSAGGAGIGGATTFTVEAGSFTTTDLSVRSDGTGGDGQTMEGSGPGNGGSGQGGTASFVQTGGTATINTLRVSASGVGGNGASYDSFLGIDAGDGGDAVGGTASVGLTGGVLNSDTVAIDANGNKSIDFGGEGGIAYVGNGGDVFFASGNAGNGGNGQGGTATLTIAGGALQDATDINDIGLSVVVNAIGEGGAGGATYLGSTDIANSGAGGAGTGGTASLLYGSGTLDATQITVAATGLGGFSGNIAQNKGLDADVAGAGGSGTGGTALFETGTTFETLTSSDNDRIITVNANGIGRSGEDGRVGGAGGTGTGGSATIRATGGITDFVAPLIYASGSGGNGGDGAVDGNGGAGGDGTGGSANIAADGSGTRLNLDGQTLVARGVGGAGGDGGSGATDLKLAGNGGLGGIGKGGAITYTASNLARLGALGQTDPENHDVSAQGGQGGLGGNAALADQTAAGNGGAGGAAIGGSFAGRAESGGKLTFGNVIIAANGTGGDGGTLTPAGDLLSSASAGGAGGDATGGSITLTASGSGSTLSVATLIASASGTGGSGANGSGVSLTTGDGAAGGVGGSGAGGTISILAEDEGLLTLAPASNRIDLVANGVGGQGGQGAAARPDTGGDGGAGGTGGVGQGGTISLAANNLGVADIVTAGAAFIEVYGSGGRGGLGGNGANTTAPATPGGNAGDTGVAAPGVGGSAILSATGGALTLGTLDVAARGITNVSAFVASPGSGPGGFGTPGQRNYALPFGGDATFGSANDEDGNTGSLQIGTTTVSVTSNFSFDGFSFLGAAGRVDLLSTSSEATNAMRFASLTVDGTGILTEQSGISVSAVSGPITVDSNLLLQSSGLVSVSTSAGADVLVGGSATIFSDSGITVTGIDGGQLDADSIELSTSGSVVISSINCPDAQCAPVHATAQLSANASGDFALFGPAVVAGLGSLEVYASGTITGDRSSGYFSNGDVLVRGAGDVTVRNATGGQIRVEAGAVIDGNTFYFPANLTLGESEGGGLFDSAGGATFVSGGGITVTAGNRIFAVDGVTFLSGNDIFVGADNLIEANTEQNSEPSSISFRAGGQAIDYELDAGDIATLSFGSGTTVNANSGTINLSGAAIDARPAAFFGQSFRADVIRQLALTDPRSTDGGRLDAACTEGAICIGDVTTGGDILIGQGTRRPLDVLATGVLSGRSVRLTALGQIQLASDAKVLATNAADLESIQGGIALGTGSVVRGSTAALSGATSLSGSGNIEATVNDVGLTFGGDIEAASITAARELTTEAFVQGAAEGSYRAPGSLRVGTLTLGTDADIGATTDLVIGNLVLGGRSAVLSAGQTLDLTTTQNVLNLDLTAPTVTFGTLDVLGDLSIDGSSVSGTSAIAGGALSIDADNLTASLLRSAGDVNLTVVETAALGTVASTGGSVNIDPVLLTFDAITAAGAINLAGGTITGGTADAGTSLDIAATGDLTLTSASSGSTMTLEAASLRSGALNAGTDLSLTVSDAIMLTGTAQAGGNLTVASASLTAPALAATGNLTVTVPGAVTLGTATAGQALSIDAGDLRFDALSGGTTSARAISVTGGTASSSGALTITASGAASLSSVAASGQASLTAASLTLPSLTAGGLSIDVTGLASLGDVTSTGAAGVKAGSLTLQKLKTTTSADIVAGSVSGATLEIGTDLSLVATGSAAFDTVTAGGLIGIRAGDLAVPTLQSGGDLTLTVTNLADLGSIQSGGTATISAGSLTFDLLKSIGATRLSGGSVTGTAIESGATLDIQVTGPISLTSVDATGAIAIAGAGVTADRVTGGGAVLLTSSGDATIGNLQATGAVTVGAGRVLTFGAIKAGEAVSLSGGTITGGTADARTGLDITATGALTLASASSGSATTLTAASLRSGALVAGTDLTLAVTAATTLTDAARAGANLAITSASVVAPSLTAISNLNVTAQGAATLGTATAGQALAINAEDLRFDGLTGNTIAVQAGSVLGGSVRSTGASTLSATRQLSLTTVDAGLAISLTGSTVTANALTAGAGISIDSAGAAQIGTASGAVFTGKTGSLTFDTITSRGSSSVTTTGNVSGGAITSVGAITVSASGTFGFTTLDGGSVSAVATLVTGGNVTARNGAIGISASGPVTLGVLSATGNIGLDASVLSFTSATAGGRFDANLSSLDSGAIAATGDVSIFSDDDLTLASLTGAGVSLGSSGAVNVAALVASGLVSVSADAVSLASPGALQISAINASNGNVDVSANGAIIGQVINARGDVLLRSLTSDVTVTRVSAGYADVFGDSLRSQATVVSGVIGQGDIRIDAARDIRIDSLADAANAFTANAGRTITLNGLATGKTMALSSRDIVIGTTGQLGETSHTTAIELENAGPDATLLGDNLGTQTTGYALSQAEFARIQSSGDLRVRGNGAMRVGNLSVAAQAGTTPGQIGQTGQLALSAGGPVSVVGSVTLSNAAGNTLSISSGQGLFVDATTGSIRLLEGQARAGTLSLSGSGIAMVTTQAQQDIANLTDTAQITERLSRNDGVTADRTLVEAGTIELRSDRNVYIQNTAASTEFAARRGLVAGDLSIGSRDGGTLDIVINGTINDATGINAIGLISFDEDSTALSSVNGCVIANIDACGVQPIIKEPFGAINVRDVIEEVLDETPEQGALPVVDSFTRSVLIQLNQISPPGFEPLIDEPVTGTGNDDMLGEEKPGE